MCSLYFVVIVIPPPPPMDDELVVVVGDYWILPTKTRDLVVEIWMQYNHRSPEEEDYYFRSCRRK